MPTRDEIIKAILPIMQAVRDGSLYDEDAADAVIATLLRMTEEPSEEMMEVAEKLDDREYMDFGARSVPGGAHWRVMHAKLREEMGL